MSDTLEQFQRKMSQWTVCLNLMAYKDKHLAAPSKEDIFKGGGRRLLQLLAASLTEWIVYYAELRQWEVVHDYVALWAHYVAKATFKNFGDETACGCIIACMLELGCKPDRENVRETLTAAIQSESVGGLAEAIRTCFTPPGT